MSAAPVDERALRLSLSVFDGPIDLLLSLIRERQLDIVTVPLALVAEQYFEYIALMEALDVELAAEYLVIAATLVFLKSKALLPPVPAEFENAEESAEAVERRLRERLIAYSKYREAGEDLKTRLLDAASFYFRDGGDPSTEMVQRYRIAADRLGAALLAVLRDGKTEQRKIVRERVSLMEQMEVVLRTVRERGRAGFFELCASLDRVGVIVTFLAVLELVRRRRIAFEQAGVCADIILRPMTEVDARAS